MSIRYQCEDIDQREKDKEVCKSWREVEVVAVAEQDRQTDEIACEKKNKKWSCICLFICLMFVFVLVYELD